MYIYAYEYIICKYIKYIYTVEDLRRNFLSKNVFFIFMISLYIYVDTHFPSRLLILLGNHGTKAANHILHNVSAFAFF